MLKELKVSERWKVLIRMAVCHKRINKYTPWSEKRKDRKEREPSGRMAASPGRGGACS